MDYKIVNDYTNKLRELVNTEYSFITKEKNHRVDRVILNNVWNHVCSIMDKIEDTIKHINLVNIRMTDGSQLAFGFIDYLNHVYNLRNYIDHFHTVYMTQEYSDFRKRSSLFNKQGLNGKGNDHSYISYLRALSGPHATLTSKYIDKYQTSIEYCAMVLWEDRIIENQFTDIKFVVYSDSEDLTKYIYINSQKIHEYILAVLDTLILSLPVVADKSKNYYNKLKEEKLKTTSDFSRYSEYLLYLNNEYNNRITSSYEDIFQYYIKLFEYDFSSLSSAVIIDRYKEAIRESIKAFESYLQTFDLTSDSFNFTDLYSPCPSGDHLNKFGYNLQKHIYLNPHYNHNSELARYLVFEMKEFFDKYIDLNEANNDFELFTMTSAALYLYSLEL
jgi:hypothetical protein